MPCSPMPPRRETTLPASTALLCLARTFCINAAVTARGMQAMGLAYALSPALHRLYPDAAARARAFARYGGHSNTHVFVAPLYLGIILSLESQIACSALPETAVPPLRDTLGATLSALGDALFSGTLLPFWALGSICLILAGLPGLTLALSCLLLLALLAFRVLSFFAALRHGIAVLAQLRRLDCINRAARLKAVNALLICLAFWLLCHKYGVGWQGCVSAGLLILAGAWLAGRLHLPRLLLWPGLLAALILMDETFAGM